MNAVRGMRQGPGHGAVMLAVALAATTGCKSGSWGAKPSWWTLGGTGGTDPAKLAAAPTFSDDVTKPSATAKPYPTTSTPEGYVLANGSQAPTASTATTATPPAPITYGSTPPAASAASLATTPPASPSPAASPAASPGLSSPATSLSSIAPQVGPYAAPAPATPPESTLPASSLGTAAPVSQPASPSAFDPAARVADARGSSAWQPTTPSPADPAAASRYGAANGSRFSGGTVEPPDSPAGFAPTSIDAPPAAFEPTSPAAFTPPAAGTAAPAAFTPPPAAAAPATIPGTTPAATPTTTLPASGRRTDPGYRPGGTSSYRSSRDMLGGEGSIQPASFESTP